MLLRQLEYGISGMRNGTGIGHHGVYSGWYGDWFSINFMIGLVSVDSEA